jgi:GAF domain-containing protein
MTYPAETQPGVTSRRNDAELSALRRVAALVARAAPVSDVFAAVADEIVQLLGVSSAMLARYDDGPSMTVVASSEEERFSVGSVWPLDGPSVSARVRATGRPARVDDYSGLAGTIATAVLASGQGPTVGVPLMVGGEVWGLMTLSVRAGDELPDALEDRLGEFTELLAIAASSSESRDRLQRLVEVQVALRQVAVLVAEGGTTAALGRLALEEIVPILGVASGWVVRYEPDNSINVVASVNDEHGFPAHSRWPLEGTSLSALILETGRPARIDDFSALEGPIAERTRASGVTSVAGVPISVEGSLWGFVCVGAADHTPLPADTEASLRDFTELLAIAIANAESRERLQRLADEQAALRRVATLVAQGTLSTEAFTRVAAEAASLLGVAWVNMVRYEDDGTCTVVGGAGDQPLEIGGRVVLDGPSVMRAVLDTGRSARIDDYSGLDGRVAEVARSAGFRSAVGVPVIVDGRTWGAIVAISTTNRIPEDIEARLKSFTELVATAVSNVQAHDDLRSLAEEQAALRRVATLVAEGSDAEVVFDAVCAETGRLVGAASVNLFHYTADGFNVTMAGWSLRGTHLPVGARFPLTPDTVGGQIVRTHAPVRIDDWEHGTSELAQLVRSGGARSSVGAPITVDGGLWGALVAATDREEAFPADTEMRLARLTDLVATAISKATTRAELMASRARIVSAGDEARRRIERNLHDGTQQRLLALGLDLQRLRAQLGPDARAVSDGLVRAEEDLESVLEDVRELSRGLHPPLLSRSGLLAPLRAIARRSPIPVEIDVDLRERPPAHVETALYYIVSEALTNAIKYSRAETISVTIEADHGGVPFGVALDGTRGVTNVHATIVDDGVGGAELAEGSGLMGLSDRVDALGGRFVLESVPGAGTRVSVMLPVEPG